MDTRKIALIGAAGILIAVIVVPTALTGHGAGGGCGGMNGDEANEETPSSESHRAGQDTDGSQVSEESTTKFLFNLSEKELGNIAIRHKADAEQMKDAYRLPFRCARLAGFCDAMGRDGTLRFLQWRLSEMRKGTSTSELAQESTSRIKNLMAKAQLHTNSQAANRAQGERSNASNAPALQQANVDAGFLHGLTRPEVSKLTAKYGASASQLRRGYRAPFSCSALKGLCDAVGNQAAKDFTLWHVTQMRNDIAPTQLAALLSARIKTLMAAHPKRAIEPHDLLEDENSRVKQAANIPKEPAGAISPPEDMEWSATPDREAR
jgi:hypothetical protein